MNQEAQALLREIAFDIEAVFLAGCSKESKELERQAGILVLNAAKIGWDDSDTIPVYQLTKFRDDIRKRFGV